MIKAESLFEYVLYNSRLLMFVAVIGALLSALELLPFAAAIAFLGLALYLSPLGDNKHQ